MNGEPVNPPSVSDGHGNEQTSNPPSVSEGVRGRSSGKRPNVVICLLDQLRAFEVGCYGNSVIQTPNIDRLAENGVRFEVACSNNPVCTPSRSILLSGQYGRTCTGSLGNAEEPVKIREQLANQTLAESFKEAGYITGLIGKWHVHVDPTLLGFDTALYPLFHHRSTGQTYLDSKGGSFTTDRYSPDVEQEELAMWVADKRDQPFFLYYNISQPHMPLADMPERYRTMYSRDQVPLRNNVRQNGKMSYDENWFKIYRWDFQYYDQHLPHAEELPRGFDLRDLTSLYYGAATWADDQVGGLVRILDQNGLLEDTIVLFASDHGDNLGSHGLFNKDVLYEESIRIPMIYHCPSRIAPRVVDTQVASLVDVMPTLLSLAGLETPDGIQGIDLSRIIGGNATEVGENAAFIETGMMQAGIRTLSHLYGVPLEKNEAGRIHAADRPLMFYDLADDPLQEHNLIENNRQSDIRSELHRRVMEWDRTTPWMGDG